VLQNEGGARIRLHEHASMPRKQGFERCLPRGNVVVAEKAGEPAPDERIVRLKVFARVDEARGVLQAGAIELVADDSTQYVLQPRFVDMNTKVLIQQIESDAQRIVASQQPAPQQPAPQQSMPLVERLLTDTVAFGTSQPALRLSAADVHLTARCAMTESQGNIYVRVLEQMLTVVWGPPGSGKSDLIHPHPPASRTLATVV
jgi:hypothetical protein